MIENLCQHTTKCVPKDNMIGFEHADGGDTSTKENFFGCSSITNTANTSETNPTKNSPIKNNIVSSHDDSTTASTTKKTGVPASRSYEIPCIDEDQLCVGKIIGMGTFCAVSEIEKVKIRGLLADPLSFPSEEQQQYDDCCEYLADAEIYSRERSIFSEDNPNNSSTNENMPTKVGIPFPPKIVSAKINCVGSSIRSQSVGGKPRQPKSNPSFCPPPLPEGCNLLEGSGDDQHQHQQQQEQNEEEIYIDDLIRACSNRRPRRTVDEMFPSSPKKTLGRFPLARSASFGGEDVNRQMESGNSGHAIPTATETLISNKGKSKFFPKPFRKAASERLSGFISTSFGGGSQNKQKQQLWDNGPSPTSTTKFPKPLKQHDVASHIRSQSCPVIASKDNLKQSGCLVPLARANAKQEQQGGTVLCPDKIKPSFPAPPRKISSWRSKSCSTVMNAVSTTPSLNMDIATTATELTSTTLVSSLLTPARRLLMKKSGGAKQSLPLYSSPSSKKQKQKHRYVLKRIRSEFKEISPKKYERGKGDLAREAKVLSRMKHPHIISMCGISMFGPSDFIILERLQETLSNRIRTWQKHHKEKNNKCSSSYEDRLTAALGIAKACSYIHSCSIVFRDLKPDNVGFDFNDTLKVFDFGVAREFNACDLAEDGINYHLTGVSGSLRYMSPEVGTSQPYNQSADVYSWSLLFWQLLKLEAPYGSKCTIEFIQKYVFDTSVNIRPVIWHSWSDSISDLLERGWDSNATNRPTFVEICNILYQELAEVKLVSTTTLSSSQHNSCSSITIGGDSVSTDASFDWMM